MKERANDNSPPSFLASLTHTGAANSLLSHANAESVTASEKPLYIDLCEDKMTLHEDGEGGV